MPSGFYQTVARITERLAPRIHARKQRGNSRPAECRGLLAKSRRSRQAQPCKVPASILHDAPDSEAPVRQPRSHTTESIHGATPNLERGRTAYSEKTLDNEQKTAEEMEAEEEALQARMENMTEQEQFREQEMKRKAVSAMVGAESTLELFELMDQLIQDDWLGGLDEFPGNIYQIAAFRPLPECTFPALTRRAGFWCIVLIQLCGPPLVFYQMVTGHSIPDPDKILWENFQSLSTSDWESGFWSTKLMAFLFLACFCINGLFVHMDEAVAWKKVDVLFRELNQCQMHDGWEILLKVGAFVNGWVIFWLCLDTFLVLGASETVKDVLLDSLGLMFLYNLDDIGGDLGFVDPDDWPGLQLAWLYKNIHKYAEEIDDVEELTPDLCCSIFLDALKILLTLFATVLPILFIFTPFQELIPDPLFEGVLVQSDLDQLVKEVLKNMTRDEL